MLGTLPVFIKRQEIACQPAAKAQNGAVIRRQRLQMARTRALRLPSPYLRHLSLDASRVENWQEYPFSLPLFKTRAFELAFERPVTIIVGENGSGKSTLLEGIAVMCGFDQAGGGKGYMPVDHSQALEKSGGGLAQALRAAWMPRITDGWFFRAETFFSVARYLNEAGSRSDFLSKSHGEGYMDFFDQRTRRQGLFIFDEPESALSPARQLEFLKLLRRMEREDHCQIIIATHSPMIMAYPDATLLSLTKYGLDPVEVTQTGHFQLLREFFADPEGFVRAMVEG